MGDFEIRDAKEGDAEALARLMRDEGYPTSTEEMRSRFVGISAHLYWIPTPSSRRNPSTSH